MKTKAVTAIVILGLALMATGSQAASTDRSATGASTPACDAPVPARVGSPAPRFTLEGVVGKEVRKISLGDYLGKWVVLFFYPNDFSFVCPTEIRGFNEALPAFHELNAAILGASVDSTYVHAAWIDRGDLGNLKFPLLSDINKKVTESYGFLDASSGTAQRALVIIDPQGNLQYMAVHNMDVGRSVEETLRVLEALQTGSLCPIDWKKGQKTIDKR